MIWPDDYWGSKKNPVVLTVQQWAIFGREFFAGHWRLVTDGENIFNLIDPHGVPHNGD